MAGTTSITIRLPNDVLAALDHQGGKRTDALVAVLRTWMAGGSAAAPDPRVAELQAEVTRLRALSVKTTVDAVATKRARDPDPQGRAVKALMGNPVFEPKLTVQGMAQPRFKKSAKVSAT